MNKEGSDWVIDILNKVSWSEESIKQGSNLQPCDINSNHFIPSSSAEKHKHKCLYRSKGYTDSEITEESSNFFYEKATDVIQLNIPKEMQSRILMVQEKDLPLTTKRSLIELSPQQRLKMYDYCVSVASSQRPSDRVTNEFCTFSDQGKSSQQPLSKLEILAMERELKRRRQSYKNKSVHQGNKSYKEVIRELLHNQMEVLASEWKQKTKS